MRYFGLKCLLKVTAAVLAGVMLTLAGCDSAPSGDEYLDANLVNGSNEAWIDDYYIGNRDGFILHSDGTYTAIWDDDSGSWYSSGDGVWSTKKGRIELVGCGYYSGKYDYALLSGTLRFDGGDYFTRMGGITISAPPSFGGGDPVLEENQAWGYCFDDGYNEPECYDFMIFRENGDYVAAYSYDDDLKQWSGKQVGTWTADGNRLTISYFLGHEEVLTYDVSGNTLSLILIRADAGGRSCTSARYVYTVRDDMDIVMIESSMDRKPDGGMKTLRLRPNKVRAR